MTCLQLRSLAVLLGIALTPCGCVTVDVGLANLMVADRAPPSAVLAKGYAVQDLVIHRGDRLIGITHAHHPESQAIIVFCGETPSIVPLRVRRRWKRWRGMRTWSCSTTPAMVRAPAHPPRQ